MHRKFWIYFLFILLLAMALRLPKLTQRPMHTDEAVHAAKFGVLLEKNYYQYNPFEYHGPTLNYLTLIPAWLTGAGTLQEIDEAILRIVPAIFGLLLIGLLIWLRDGLSRPVILMTGLLTALSPAMVFYSRYYIQEMLLVFFTFGAIVAGFRYWKSKRWYWAAATGIFLGLMHATKETFVIAGAAMTLALLLMVLTSRNLRRNWRNFTGRFNYRHLLLGILAAMIVSMLLFSSFLEHPGSILDSVLTYKTYLQRAGQHEWHIHPWFYYFQLLLFRSYPEGPIWTEMVVLIFSLLGILSVLKGRSDRDGDAGFLRFWTFYTVILTAIYMAIPYKTPWTMLGFYHGFILLAAVGIVNAVRLIKKKAKYAALVIIIIALFHFGLQAVWLNYRYDADPSNPYVYAHTSKDVFEMVKRVQDVAAVSETGKNLYIEVICPGNDYWPLPWYLRAYSNVGWWDHVNWQAPIAPVILAFPSVEDELLTKLYELPPPGQKNLYVPLFDTYMELRPQVEMRGYVVKELWDQYCIHQSGETK